MERKIDDLGRVVLPKPCRQQIGMLPGDIVDIAVEGDLMRVRKRVHRCAVCGETDETMLHELSGRYICEACLHKAKEIMSGGDNQ